MNTIPNFATSLFHMTTASPLIEFILVALLVFGAISFVIANWGPAPNFSDFSEAGYNALPVAWPLTIVIWALLALLLRAIAIYGPITYLTQLHEDTAMSPDKILMMTYLVGFIAMWIVYFTSKLDIRFIKTRTLRTLLGRVAKNWNNPEDSDNFSERALDEFEAMQRTKADSSVQSLAIMAASAAVVLSLSSELRQALMSKNEYTIWPEAMLTVAMATAILSFYCFVIAVDILDTVFNRFHQESRKKLLMHFYPMSLNPKYIGLMLLMLSIALYVAATQPAMGALALAAATFIGYSHWFPRLDPRQGWKRAEWLLRIVLLLVPVAVIQFAS